MPITRSNALLKLLRNAITAYGKANKVKGAAFDERLKMDLTVLLYQSGYPAKWHEQVFEYEDVREEIKSSANPLYFSHFCKKQ